MNIRTGITVLILYLMAAPVVAAQGFAGLGTTADGFAKVRPGQPIVLPDDFGPHPDYRIEWWYVTANLQTATGDDIGIQWTLFRQATKPGATKKGWSTHEFWMGHAALTTTSRHFATEKIARGGTGQAGANAAPFEAWIDNWDISRKDENSPFSLKADGDGFGYTLKLKETGPPVRHGADGYSVKSEQGQASYYFSYPFLAVTGQVTINGKTMDVTGDAWLDREWSSQPLAENQDGWDWFSLRLDGGERLMAFALRDSDGAVFRSGSWITADGRLEPLGSADIHLTPIIHSTVTGRRIPTGWSVRIPSKGVDIVVQALNENAWMSTSIAYWEGPVAAGGSHRARGYLEMTGY